MSVIRHEAIGIDHETVSCPAGSKTVSYSFGITRICKHRATFMCPKCDEVDVARGIIKAWEAQRAAPGVGLEGLWASSDTIPTLAHLLVFPMLLDESHEPGCRTYMHQLDATIRRGLSPTYR